MDLESLGFDFYPVETRDGTEVFCLKTPFLLAGEFEYDIFVEESGGRFHIFDEGMTLHSLMAAGEDITDSRVASIRKLLDKHQVVFTDFGSFEKFGPASDSPRIIADYLTAMQDLNQWVCALFEKKASQPNFVETVKLMFRLWKPEARIMDAPKVRGINGQEIRFDFAVDNTYVDAFKPVPRSSADFIRKLVVCFDVEGRRLRTLGVLDDREEREKALTEMKVISRITQTMLYTDLVANAEKHKDRLFAQKKNDSKW